ncbi:MULTISPECIES: NAD(P)H-binding protein [Exiguobacterium]|uniref:NmrA family transcriptional regulator n=1 Tax=Exiguobacterium oxidotolerans TaxID=223958 RepID=A0A653I326_9BACL|nr:MULTISPECIES: NAD(P)H-binding protein [Exiguobacterium]ASI34541.1 NmrA family transcriptional regulator [Exiguobacterium sp. N4-1P]VWX33357.1 NmrA family transcriptional regulator [Exiguobacterium oxidotolerans]
MNVLVVGASGTIGARVVKSLAKGHQVTVIVRHKHLVDRFEKLGVKAHYVDIETELEKVIDLGVAGQNAVICAATAGVDGEATEIELLDRTVALKTIDAAKKARVRHFVLLSAYGADRPNQFKKEVYPFYAAKNAAEEQIEHSGLTYTIICPVNIVDGEGLGLIEADEDLKDVKDATISEIDVASILAASVDNRALFNRRLEVKQGKTSLNEALGGDESFESIKDNRRVKQQLPRYN